MAGLSRVVTEAIIETRWEYFGGSINSKSPTGPQGPERGQPSLLLSQGGSLWILATDWGLITCEDILINRQILDMPHPSCPHPLPGLQSPPPQHTKQKQSTSSTTHQEETPEGFSGKRGR